MTKPIVVETTVTIDDQKLKGMIARLKEANAQFPDFFLFTPLQDEDELTTATNIVDRLASAGIESVPLGADEDAELLRSLFDHLNDRIADYNEQQDEDEEDDEEGDEEGDDTDDTDEEEDEEEDE